MIKGATLAMFLSLANITHELPNSANSRHAALILQYRLHRCISRGGKNAIGAVERCEGGKWGLQVKEEEEVVVEVGRRRRRRRRRRKRRRRRWWWSWWWWRRTEQ
jgi:hypothetical protein